MSKGFKSYVLYCWKCGQSIRYQTLAEVKAHIDTCQDKKKSIGYYWRSGWILTWVLLLTVTLVGFLAQRGNNLEQDAYRFRKELSVKTLYAKEVSDTNQKLKEKLERSASYQTDPAVKKVSEFYIDKYFGAEAETVKKVMTCESGLDNRREHINDDGSKDMGLYQIHDEPTHRKNIQKMFGVSIEVAAYDFEMSSKYAKFLWDRSPNNWVCYGLI